MALRLYDSFLRRMETLTPSRDGTLRVFVCGPTVYDYAHLGHARTYISFDIILRYLTFLGHKVRYLMNITDIAESIVKRAAELKRDPFDIAREYEKAFLEDMESLRITNVERYERASAYIPEMIAQVKGLMNKGVAYETETGVYFEVKKFPKFGQLSGQSQEELGLRRLELCSSKRNAEDFSLWRRYERGLGWDSPWGYGRPGWHIEDTAISMTNFGETYDIHCGASELIFPHHEAEIAQAEALTGKSPFVRFWLHTGLLSVRGRKMSKSLGNVLRIRDALETYTAAELRYYFASFHYRQPMAVSNTGLRLAKHRLNSMVKNFQAFLKSKSGTGAASQDKKLMTLVQRAKAIFVRRMDNDFDTPNALRALTDLSYRLSELAKPGLGAEQAKRYAEREFRKMADVFGIL